MKKIVKLLVLILVIVTISACGRMGKLERIKSENQKSMQCINQTTIITVALG